MQREIPLVGGLSLRLVRKSALLGLATAIAASFSSAFAGTAFYEFTTDPTTDPNLVIAGNNDQPWQETTGNPGGFLALTYSQNSQDGKVVFPDIDPGKIVTAFKFEADLRVGNSTGDRGADGFSVSFARAGDPVLENPADNAGFAGGIPEGGTTTGIAVSFDTWAGNTLPDSGDIEGIIVRVDNKTVLLQGLPTRHGACDDNTSLQTGPRNAQYWADGGDARLPEAWAGLCWQPFSIELDVTGKLTVIWKGRRVLDGYQTEYFPTASRLVLAARTGGANENTHFDNIRLTTTAVEAGAPPTDPTNLQATTVGARRVALTWGASTDAAGRVSYEVERNGVKINSGLLTTNVYVDLGAKPGVATTYRVRAVNVAGATSGYATLNVTTAAEVAGQGFLLGEIFDSVAGTAVQGLLDDPKYQANTPDRTAYLNGLSFGETSNFGNTFGENFGIRIKGTLTVPETGQYHFFLRSDDASQFFLNGAGAALPVPGVDAALMQEDGCCAAFQETDIGDARTTATPVSLTAGTQYGFVYIVKEGGGGDWGQVAMRKVGDTTPASSLSPIRGPLVTGVGDPVGANVTITTQPASQTVVANEAVTFSVSATHTSPYGAPIVYQWYRNNQIIAGATASSYTIPVALATDNNAVYKVWVGTLGANVTSSDATLTVQTDTKAPTIASVTPDDTFTRVTVKFSEPVTSPTATTAGNYTLSGGRTVSAAERVDNFTIRLTTSQLAEETDYTLTVVNVADNAGNPTAANTTATFKSWGLVSNRAQLQLFNNIAGTATQGLYDDPKFPNSPDSVLYRSGLSFGEETNFGNTYGDNFGAVMRGWLIPTETAQYHFFIRSDDASQLYVSADATLPNPLTSTAIAEETGCCEGFKEPDPNAVQPFETTITPISLTAGQRYGVVFVVKEGGGGDWGQVAWRKVGDTTAAGSLPFISNHVYYFGPQSAPPQPQFSAVTRSGNNLTITWTGAGTLESSPTVGTGATWTAVAGAGAGTATVPVTGAGLFFRIRQ